MGNVIHRIGIGNVLKGKGQGNINEGDVAGMVMRADSEVIKASTTIYRADGDEQ